jgi:hypothetical protein
LVTVYQKSNETVDALIVITAEACAATDIATTEATDVRRLSGGSTNVIER